MNNNFLRNLMLTVVVVFSLSSLISVGCIVYQSSVLNQFSTYLTEDAQHESDIRHLNYLFKVQVQEWKNVLLRGADDERRQKYWNAFQERESEIQDIAAELLRAIGGGPGARELEAFISSHQKMAREYRRGFDEFVASGFVSAVGDSAVSGIDREPAKLLSDSATLIMENIQQRVEASNSQRSTINALALPTVVLTSIAAILGVAGLFTIFVLRPIRRALDIAGHLAKGDLTVSSEEFGRGEVRAFSVAIVDMQKRLIGMLKVLQDGVVTLKDSAKRFDDVTSKMEEQSIGVEGQTTTLASSVTEMAAAAQQIAEHAASAALAAASAEQSSEAGRTTVNATVSKVSTLAGEMQRVVEAMASLEQDSSKIGSVLDVIKGVAEQTNLLALNAAIEAARAGEQGRGFAVVADEVRTLAQRTQESTEEIHSIITKLQDGTRQAVDALRLSEQRTQECVTSSQEAGEAISGISGAIDEINQMNTQVATAAEEQSAVSDGITENITMVAETCKEAAEMAAAARAVSRDLETLAGQISGATGQFRV